MVVNLPRELAAYAAEQVGAGHYGSEAELLCDAVRVLQERRQAIKNLIAEGMAHPEEDSILKDDTALAEFFAGLTEELSGRSMSRNE
jgi:putative addiction module CopG family antidote